MPKLRKPKKFYLEIYDITYLFFIGWDKESYSKYVENKLDYECKMGPSDEGETFFIEEQKTIVIWVKNGKNNLPVLCHEVVHAACFTLHWCGVKPDYKNDENLAYLAQLLFSKATSK